MQTTSSLLALGAAIGLAAIIGLAVTTPPGRTRTLAARGATVEQSAGLADGVRQQLPRGVSDATATTPASARQKLPLGGQAAAR